ncbi:MAG: transposase family protein [Blastochloris sp.]|nr:transposase family protein [Blastochloris sp.]
MSFSDSNSVAAPLAAVVQALLPEAVALQLHQVLVTPEGLTLPMASTDPEAICPDCAQPSQRVQSRYLRTLADLPWGQRPVCIQLQVRRFRCGNEACPRSIFTERLPKLVQPYARRTLRLQHHLTELAFALGSEGAARHCQRDGLSISPANPPCKHSPPAAAGPSHPAGFGGGRLVLPPGATDGHHSGRLRAPLPG